jgi:uncharacterized membrane protein YkoI
MAVNASRVRMGIAAGAATLALAVGGAGIAGAATSSSSTSTAAKAAAKAKAATPATANATDPATLTHGPGETLVTGSDLAKATAAANAAVPGATILRVETDSGGAAYEAHLKKADGSNVTVKFDASFNVTSTQEGFGSGGRRP